MSTSISAKTETKIEKLVIAAKKFKERIDNITEDESGYAYTDLQEASRVMKDVILELESAASSAYNWGHRP